MIGSRSLEVETPTRFDYSEPVKRIHDSKGLQAFQQSRAIFEIQKVLTKIVELVESKEVPAGVLSQDLLYTKEEVEHFEHDTASGVPIFNEDTNIDILKNTLDTKPYIAALLNLFDELSRMIDDVPPLDGPRRYGNLACRDWHSKLEGSIDERLQRLLLPFYKLENPQGFILEIKWYILNAFGSKERLDFGTGHELNFLAFITGLLKVKILPFAEISGPDFLIIFGRYYDLVRKLITIYTLEPAGSHGVWGLDDHFHLIYILGASELLNISKKYPTVSPKMINNRSIVFQYSLKNLYFNAIAFIYKVKKGYFFEHSPILYDISNIRNWDKILSGMLKMYQAEVFKKFPVVQHFYFGNVLFPWRSVTNDSALPIHTSDEDLSAESNIASLNNDWKHLVSHHHQLQQQPEVLKHFPESTTAAPWAKTSSAPSSSLSSRIPPHTVQGTHGLPVTKAPWAKK